MVTSSLVYQVFNQHNCDFPNRVHASRSCVGSSSLVHQQSSGGGWPLEQRPVAFFVALTFARAETFTLYLFSLGNLRYITKDCHPVTSNYLVMNF